MLKLAGVEAFYGSSRVLHGVDFEVPPGRIVALLGRNGAGRSTTAKAIMGLVPWTGHIAWKGLPLAGKRAFEVARLGIGYMPETRDIFPTLTVQQNLLLGQKRGGKQERGSGGWSFEDMYRMFPQLEARRHVEAGVLSGGEQQMLCLCRSLMGNPALLVMDEPAEGLAPQMVEHVANCLRLLRERGVAVLLIEQKLSLALDLSDSVLVMGRGKIVFAGAPDTLLRNDRVRGEWLEI